MRSIGPYRIEAGPFRGGFGEVYHVFDSFSGDEFALKTLPEALLPGASGLDRFRAEIAIWIRLSTHPNVVRAIRAFEDDGRPYVLIEWFGGGDLADNRSRLLPATDPERSIYGSYRHLEVMRQLCAGVAHIHAHECVHGDLKPGNVMMWQGLSPAITDFGLARIVGAATAVTSGTWRYMAPELRDRGESTPAVDIFAAGVIFRELLADISEQAAGRAAAVAIADAMAEADPGNRPSSFVEIEAELAAVIDAAPIRPGIPVRAGERLTWGRAARGRTARSRTLRTSADRVHGRAHPAGGSRPRERLAPRA